MRWNPWKTMPIRSRRSRVRRDSDHSVTSSPSTRTRPLVGASRPAAQLRNVDLPDPDGPMTAVKVPVSKARSTPSSARTAVGSVP